MKRIVLLLFLGMLVSACTAQGAVNPSAPVTPIDRTNPSAIHTAWLQAVQANDPAAVASLMGRSDNPSEQLQSARALFEHINLAADDQSTTGGFTGVVEDLGMEADGAMRYGISRWHFAQQVKCYRFELSEIAHQWRVMGWWYDPYAPCEELHATT